MFGPDEQWILGWTLWRDFFSWLSKQSSPESVGALSKLDLLSQLTERAHYFLENDSEREQDTVRATIFETLCAYFSAMRIPPSASIAHKYITDAQKQLAEMLERIADEGPDPLFANFDPGVSDACKPSLERTLTLFSAVNTYVVTERLQRSSVLMAMRSGQSVGDTSALVQDILVARAHFDRVLHRVLTKAMRTDHNTFNESVAETSSSEGSSATAPGVIDDTRATDGPIVSPVRLVGPHNSPVSSGKKGPVHAIKSIRRRVTSESARKPPPEALEALRAVRAQAGAGDEGDEKVLASAFVAELWAMLVNNSESSRMQTENAYGAAMDTFLRYYRSPQLVSSSSEKRELTTAGSQIRMLNRILDEPLSNSEFVRSVFQRAAYEAGTNIRLELTVTDMLRLHHRTVPDNNELTPAGLRIKTHPYVQRMATLISTLIVLLEALSRQQADREREWLLRGVPTFRHEETINMNRVISYVRFLTAALLEKYKEKRPSGRSRNLDTSGLKPKDALRLACPSLSHSNSDVF